MAGRCKVEPDQQKLATLVQAKGRASDHGESPDGLCALRTSTHSVIRSFRAEGILRQDWLALLYGARPLQIIVQ